MVLFKSAFINIYLLVLTLKIKCVLLQCTTSSFTTTLCNNVTLPLKSNIFICSYCNELVFLNTKITEIFTGKNFVGYESYKIFDFRNISLENIETGSFEGTPNLETIYLSRNNLSTINAGVFNHLTNLTVLDLSENSIKSIKPNAFNGNNILKLNLSYNDFESMKNELTDLKSLATLDLSNNKLLSLNFTNIPVNTKVILASNNTNLTVIKGCNVSTNCFNPYTLDLSNNNLTNLDSDTFKYLENIQKILLQKNNINNLPVTIFSSVLQIEYLNLSYNRLESLPSGVFSMHTKLQILDVSNNRISVFDESNFRNMYNLKRIYIQNNLIKNFDVNNILDKNLEYINLDGNQFDCNNLFVIIQELLKIKVKVANGNHGSSVNIYGNLCYWKFNPNNDKYFKSNILPVVFITLTVSIVGISIPWCIRYKCKNNRRESELQLFEL